MEIIKSFQNNTAAMHITIRGSYEEPLFRASDIGEVLDITHIRTSVQDFDNTEKHGVRIMDIIGREQETTFLTEKGLYKLLFRSRKPIAKQFTDWVCEVIKEIRLNSKYRLEQQIKDLEHKTEENLLLNSSEKKLVYLGLVEDNIVKFGQSKGIESRVSNGHKKDFSNFVLKYTIHSDFHIELEESIKKACKDKTNKLYNRRISKMYNEKKQTELIRLDENFTIEDLYIEIKQLNKNLIESKTIGELKEENEKLKKENEKLKNENNMLKKTNELFISRNIEESKSKLESDPKPTKLESDPKSTKSITDDEKQILDFLEEFISNTAQNEIKISNKDLYDKYVEYVDNVDNVDNVVNVVSLYKFGCVILKCPSITTILGKINSSDSDRIRLKQIKVHDTREWLKNLDGNITNNQINPISKNANTYQVKNLLSFLIHLIKTSKEEKITISNQQFYDLYKSYEQKSDLTFAQFGLYVLKIPGITKIKTNKIWSKIINCKIVNQYITSI